MLILILPKMIGLFSFFLLSYFFPYIRSFPIVINEINVVSSVTRQKNKFICKNNNIFILYLSALDVLNVSELFFSDACLFARHSTANMGPQLDNYYLANIHVHFKPSMEIEAKWTLSVVANLTGIRTVLPIRSFES